MCLISCSCVNHYHFCANDLCPLQQYLCEIKYTSPIVAIRSLSVDHQQLLSSKQRVIPERWRIRQDTAVFLQLMDRCSHSEHSRTWKHPQDKSQKLLRLQCLLTTHQTSFQPVLTNHLTASSFQASLLQARPNLLNSPPLHSSTLPPFEARG